MPGAHCQGVGTSGLRFADGETLAGVLKVAQGSVTPLATMHDEQHQVIVLLAKSLAEAQAVVRLYNY